MAAASLTLAACSLSYHAQAQESSIEALLERSAERQQESTTDEQAQDLPDEPAKEESQTQQEDSSLEESQKRTKLSLRPTISISEITVPEFEGISVGGISAVEIEDRRRAIYWWNDTVARQATSLLSRMIVRTGGLSVQESSDSQYTLLAEVTSYEEDSREDKGGGFNMLIFGNRRETAKIDSVITLEARIIDTKTNAIIHETFIRAEAEAVAKGGGGFVNLGIVRFDGGKSKAKVRPPIEEALQLALEKASDYVKCVLVTKDSCLGNYDNMKLRL